MIYPSVRELGDWSGDIPGALIIAGVACGSGPRTELVKFRGIEWAPRHDTQAVECEMPLPLLWRHEAPKRIGLVTWLRGERRQLKFRASIPHPDSPHGFRPDFLRFAWQEVRSGRARCVSIAPGHTQANNAFAGLDEHGNHVYRWWLDELSVCEKGARDEAVIEDVLVPEDLLLVETKMREQGLVPDLLGGIELPSVSKQVVTPPREMSVGGFRVEKSADDSRVAALETRIAELEAKAKGERFGWVWMGAWKEGAYYWTNNHVTHNGSSWICLQDGATDRPGSGGSGWDLVSRHGRDARK